MDPLLLAQSLGPDLGLTDLLVKLAPFVALIAILGIAMVLPLFLRHRTEIQRLLLWRKLEPHKGEGIGGEPIAPAVGAGSRALTGPLTPAERVTVNRPALQRITNERAALESPSFWRRLIAGGPRHPLALSAIALLAAAIAVSIAYLVLSGPAGKDGGGNPTAISPSSVEVIVLNGSSQSDLAATVGEGLQESGFQILSAQAIDASFEETQVLFAKGQQRPARLVAREIGEREVMPITPQVKSAAGPSDVVIIAGEDRTRMQSKAQGQQGRRGG